MKSWQQRLEHYLKILFYVSYLVLFMFWASVKAAPTHFYVSLTQCNVSAPDIIFKAGTNGTAYVISTNKTWAEINVNGSLETTYYEYILNITNISSSMDFQLKQEITSTNGINRLSNFTAYFLYEGATSKQVEISNGTVTQYEGSWYSIVKSVTIYLSLAIEVSTLGNSSVDLRLHIIKSGETAPELIQTITINVT
jgi:hypothetical protein